jgi:hypothetical protein
MVKSKTVHCSELVKGLGGWYSRECSRTATVKENGKNYCRQHAPSLVQARRAAQNKRWDETWSKRRKAMREAERRRRIAEEVIKCGCRHCATIITLAWDK